MHHKLAIKIARILDADNVVDSEDKVLLIFGIEVFLNEFLKIAIIFIVAAFIGQLTITLFATVYLLILRKYAKGKHCNSNLKCYVITIITTCILPIICVNINLPIEVSITMIILITVVFCIRLSNAFDIKVKLLSAYYIGILGGYLIGQWAYVNALLIVALIVAIATDTPKEKM